MNVENRMSDRRLRLARVARQLAPRVEQLPYYISTPPGPNREQAPGWWMLDAGGQLRYLGANAFRAELHLTQRVELQRARARGRVLA